MALKQSSRDMLLSLRKEIEHTLKQIVASQVRDSLTSDNLSKIIGDVINNFLSTKKSEVDIKVALNAKDLNQLKGSFISKLQKQLKDQIKFQSSEDIGKGFTISFDGGKSSFDFTDESLADYLSTFLNAQVAEFVKEASAS